MKTLEVQKLEIGTKLYRMVFDVEGVLGNVTADIQECEVRENAYSSGKHIARPVTWRGVTTWRSVRPRWCYLQRYQAERELAQRIRVLREKLYTLESNAWKVQ